MSLMQVLQQIIGGGGSNPGSTPPSDIGGDYMSPWSYGSPGGPEQGGGDTVAQALGRVFGNGLGLTPSLAGGPDVPLEPNNPLAAVDVPQSGRIPPRVLTPRNASEYGPDFMEQPASASVRPQPVTPRPAALPDPAALTPDMLAAAPAHTATVGAGQPTLMDTLGRALRDAAAGFSKGPRHPGSGLSAFLGGAGDTVGGQREEEDRQQRRGLADAANTRAGNADARAGSADQRAQSMHEVQLRRLTQMAEREARGLVGPNRARDFAQALNGRLNARTRGAVTMPTTERWNEIYREERERLLGEWGLGGAGSAPTAPGTPAAPGTAAAPPPAAQPRSAENQQRQLAEARNAVAAGRITREEAERRLRDGGVAVPPNWYQPAP